MLASVLLLLSMTGRKDFGLFLCVPINNPLYSIEADCIATCKTGASSVLALL
jgi:hypothetical protein